VFSGIFPVLLPLFFTILHEYFSTYNFALGTGLSLVFDSAMVSALPEPGHFILATFSAIAGEILTTVAVEFTLSGLAFLVATVIAANA